jgi:hypothetical protein
MTPIQRVGGKVNGTPVAGAPGGGKGAGARVMVGAVRRKRLVPYAAVGALLIVGCALAFGVFAVQLGHRTMVVCIARPVWAGQAITSADLRLVSAADDGSLGLIPAAQQGSLVGQTPVVPLTAGTLLTRAMLGVSQFPPVGQLTASLALKPGQYPQHLAAGARVAIFVNAAPGLAPAATPTQAVSGSSAVPGDQSGGTPRRIVAVVLDVAPAADGQGGAVVELQLAADAAARLAAAPVAGVVVMQTSAEN